MSALSPRSLLSRGVKKKRRDWLDDLNSVDLKTLSSCSHFSVSELNRLKTRFTNLADGVTGLVSKESLLQEPELVFNPLISRLVDVHLNLRQIGSVLNHASDSDAAFQSLEGGTSPQRRAQRSTATAEDDMAATSRMVLVDQVQAPQGLSFESFVTLLSALHPTAPINEKVQFFQTALDFNGDGSVSSEEVHMILEMVLGGSCPDTVVAGVVEDVTKGLMKYPAVNVKVLTSLLSQRDLENRLSVYF